MTNPIILEKQKESINRSLDSIYNLLDNDGKIDRDQARRLIHNLIEYNRLESMKRVQDSESRILTSVEGKINRLEKLYQSIKEGIYTLADRIDKG